MGQGKGKEMKANKQPAPEKKRRDVVEIRPRFNEDTADDEIARKLTQPAVNSAVTIQRMQGENHEVNALTKELQTQVDQVNRGDLRRAEALLVAQSHTLDEIFNNLARRAHGCISVGYLNAGETHMRLALKAQTQCRATLETLANIKNPPVVYAKQANVTTGPQQINNGVPAREIKSLHNEQSGATLELPQDTGTPALTGATNPTMEAVGKIHRAKDRPGKS